MCLVRRAWADAALAVGIGAIGVLLFVWTMATRFADGMRDFG